MSMCAAFLSRASQWLAHLCLIVSSLLLFVLMGVTVVEVIGRYLFNAPLYGRQDIAQILLALTIFFAFPVVTLRGEHIDVDLLDFMFSKKVAFWRDRIIEFFVGISLMTMAVWLLTRAEKMLSRNEVSELLFLPKYPLIYAITFSVFLSAFLVFVMIFIKIKRE